MESNYYLLNILLFQIQGQFWLAIKGIPTIKKSLIQILNMN